MIAPLGLAWAVSVICESATPSGASAAATSQRSASPMGAGREVRLTPNSRLVSCERGERGEAGCFRSAETTGRGGRAAGRARTATTGRSEDIFILRSTPMQTARISERAQHSSQPLCGGMRR